MAYDIDIDVRLDAYGRVQNDHTRLINRDAEDQHPISAITGLQDALDSLVPKEGSVTGVKGGAEEEYRVGNVNITKADIGLGNADDTADLDKPISIATQEALDNKQDKFSEVTERAGKVILSTHTPLEVQKLHGNDVMSSLTIDEDEIKLDSSQITIDGHAVLNDSDIVNINRLQSEIVANPTASGEETDLIRLKVGNNQYNIPAKTTVDDLSSRMIVAEQDIDTLEATKQENLISGTNIKTVDGNSLLGSGNVVVRAYQPLKPSWDIASTTADFCDSIREDNTAVAGMAYMGKIQCSDLPGLVQGECVVDIISNGDANGKDIHLSLSSLEVYPYKWEFNYALVNGSYINTGWIGYQPKLTAGQNVSIVNDVISAVDTIPNNATLNIKAEGTSLGTFTANASQNVDINITASSLGLSGALRFKGTAVTTQLSAGQYIKTTIGSTIVYTSITNTGTPIEIPAELGWVILYNNAEYYCNVAGTYGTNEFAELGDESSFALKSITINAGTGLTGGGTLEENRTISLADNYGDTLNPYASKTANYVLAAPNGSNGAPTFRPLVKADIPLASEPAVQGGTTTSLVTDGEKYIWNAKQEALVSGTNIKSINNTSLLGSGDMTIVSATLGYTEVI